MTHDHGKLIDGLAALFAGVAAVSLLSKLALVVTILSGLVSLSLGALRWHDRLRYGPRS